MKRQAGFTLIELVMVIVILGILSAFALPRFADLGADARLASLNAALGAVRSSTAIVRADVLVNNNTTNTVTLEGQAIALVNGYPAGTAAGIQVASQLDANDYTLDFATTAGSMVVTLGTCQFTYAESAAANAAPVISAITGQVNGGC